MKVSKAVESEKEIRDVFLDISKAFDRMLHKGLVNNYIYQVQMVTYLHG